jgi:hypothetical protein
MQPLLNGVGSGGYIGSLGTRFSTLKMQTTNLSETMANINLYGVPTENIIIISVYPHRNGTSTRKPQMM